MGTSSAAAAPAVVAPSAAAPPLSARLRRLVVEVARPATLTCQFMPGGRIRGAGIVSPQHCAHCNQSLLWHEVAAAIPIVESAEAHRAAAEEDRTV